MRKLMGLLAALLGLAGVAGGGLLLKYSSDFEGELEEGLETASDSFAVTVAAITNAVRRAYSELPTASSALSHSAAALSQSATLIGELGIAGGGYATAIRSVASDLEQLAESLGQLPQRDQLRETARKLRDAAAQTETAMLNIDPLRTELDATSGLVGSLADAMEDIHRQLAAAVGTSDSDVDHPPIQTNTSTVRSWIGPIKDGSRWIVIGVAGFLVYLGLCMLVLSYVLFQRRPALSPASPLHSAGPTVG